MCKFNVFLFLVPAQINFLIIKKIKTHGQLINLINQLHNGDPWFVPQGEKCLYRTGYHLVPGEANSSGHLSLYYSAIDGSKG
jgi:hypothetical protein